MYALEQTSSAARRMVAEPFIDEERMTDRTDFNPKGALARFQRASPWRAQWQIANSLIPYALLWYAMYHVLSISYWVMLPIAVLAAGFLARIFIIFHDCGHASFFKSKRANNVWGAIAGVFNLTPYRHWRWQHALHHGPPGHLSRRAR